SSGSFVNVVDGGVYSGATSPILTLTGVPSSFNTYTYRVVVSGACTPSTTSTAGTLTVNTLPVVTSDPSDVTQCEGTSTSFTVTATGTSLTYQWQEDAGVGFTNLSNGGVYSNVTTATLNLSDISGLGGNRYRVVVSGACSPSTTSASALLTEDLEPIADLSGVTDTEICSDESSYLIIGAVATNSGGITWSNGTGDGIFIDNTVLNPTYVPGTNDIINGSVTLTMTLAAPGVCTTPSADNLTLTINPSATADAGLDQTICSSENVLLSGSVGGAASTGTWTTSGDGTFNISGTAIGTLGTDTEYIPGAGDRSGGMVTLTLTSDDPDAGGPCSAANSSINVTINPDPSPSIVPSNTSVCEGDVGETYSVSPVVGDSYNWTVVGGTITSGAGTNSITVDWGTAGLGNVSVVQITSATGCSQTANQPITINSNPTPAISGDNVVCAGEMGLTYSTPNIPGNTYDWSITGGTITSATNTNSVTVTWGVAGAGTLQVTETVSATGCLTINVLNISINPIPALTNLPLGTQVCSGDQLNFTPTSDVAGTVFTWTVSAPASITGETNGTGTIDDVLTNTSDAIQTVVYTVTATGPGPSNCVNPLTGDYTVTVYPVVDQTIVNNSPVVCEGEPLSLDYATPTENGDIVLTATYPAGV
ncbi:MAG: hypothetical protein MJA30_22000, partial [Cytophagales bacterium]|nr:hypothetical protein [Cytophagales bacterium]